MLNEKNIDAHVEESTHRRHTPRLVAVGVLVAIVAALAVDNRQRVTISYLVGDADAPLFLALVTAVALGWLVGWLTSILQHRERT